MNDPYLPIDVTVEVTRKCPLNCLICSSEGGSPYRNELALSELKGLISDAHELGTQTICFSGGEPLEHPHIVELCRHSKCLGLNVYIYTSGNSSTDDHSPEPIKSDMLTQLAELSVNKIIVGLQGPNKEVHESITRVQGSFQNAVISIQKAVKKSIPVEIHCVPVKLNYEALPEMIDLANRLGVEKISILRFVPQGRGKTYQSLLSLRSSDLLTLKSILKRMIESKTSCVRIGAPFNAFGLSEACCTVGESRATVRADGLVFPCEAMKQLPYSFDNDLHTKSLQEIWEKSEIFRDARAFASLMKRTKCVNCKKLQKCGGGCPAQRLTSSKHLQSCPDPYCLEKEVAVTNV